MAFRKTLEFSKALIQTITFQRKFNCENMYMESSAVQTVRIPACPASLKAQRIGGKHPKEQAMQQSRTLVLPNKTQPSSVGLNL